MTHWQTIRHLYTHFGGAWFLYRTGYRLAQRTGLLALRTPPSQWATRPLARYLHQPQLADPVTYAAHRRQHAPRFFFHPQQRAAYQPLLTPLGDAALDTAEQIVAGVFPYYTHQTVKMGFPPAWHRHPFTGEQMPTDKHWSRIGDFAHGDIKAVWELSRFGFAYPLVRAYWCTADERYPHAFWQLLQDWHHHNPPNWGVNWKCGQEASLRVMACCFALYGFGHSPHTTPERLAMLAQMMAVSAERIAANIHYALSQRNNHAISEGLGLWTIGTLFPEFKQATHWERRGRQILERQGCDLITPSGAFAQHSFNYQRLMLHAYLWCLRLAELNQRPFSADLQERIARAGQLLAHFQWGADGRLPNYGQNDGAFILPLSDCGPSDYRPLLQAAHFLAHGRRRAPSGAWDEPLLWLFGPAALTAPLEPERLPVPLHTPQTGYTTWHGHESHLFLRGGRFQERPAQADLLHADLWWRGHNIALDPGTYSYNAPHPWNNPLAETAYHNTVTVDGQSQMRRISKFIWLPWVRGRLWRETPTQWVATHDGYRHLGVVYQRHMHPLPNDSYGFVDWLHSHTAEAHRYTVHWLLPACPYTWDEASGELCLQTAAGPFYLYLWSDRPAEYRLVTADPHTPFGWHAPHYHHKQPALSVRLSVTGPQATLASWFTPHKMRVKLEEERWQLYTAHWRARVQWVSRAPRLRYQFTIE